MTLNASLIVEHDGSLTDPCTVKSFIKEDAYPPPWTEPDTNDVYYANNTDMLTGNYDSDFWAAIEDANAHYHRDWASSSGGSSYACLRNVRKRTASAEGPEPSRESPRILVIVRSI